MDRFEQFEEDIVSKLNTYKRNWINTRTALFYTSENDTERFKELIDELVECQHHIWFTERQYNNFINEKEKIDKMLNGFYIELDCYRSFIYPNIYVYSYEDGIFRAYKVEDKTFYSLDEAKEYAKSFGVNKDWKDKVYQYL